MNGPSREYFARCASGFESVLALELRGLHARQVRPLKGGAAFFGTVETAYQACLWLRVATRVQLVLARVPAADADELYEAAAAFPWEGHIAPGATIAVSAHGVNDELRNTQFTALKVKDAVCDHMRAATGERPDVNPKHPDISIDVSLHRQKATLYLNLSGESLHRRGYREEGVQGAAPLKETLAAGMLLASGWKDMCVEGGAFIDPMCGSGTLALEAAMIAADCAPGLLRRRWGFQGWTQHDPVLWEQVRASAEERLGEGLKRVVPIMAGDIDPRAVELAKANASRCPAGALVKFYVSDAVQLGASLAKRGARGLAPKGLLAANPPYGHRLQNAAELRSTYAALASVVDAVPDGWKLAIITPDDGIDTALGQTPEQTIGCYNGAIEAKVRLYTVAPSQRLEIAVVGLDGVERRVTVAERNSEQFAARLRKVAKERAKWARKQNISCYRIYDADLPDYNVSVDMYLGAGRDAGAAYVRVAEYQAPSSVDPAVADRRFNDALAIIPAVLGVPGSDVFSKVRRRAKGGGQYREARGSSKVVHTSEGGFDFEVDLGGYLDTGLFLDHRTTRHMVGDMASGTRFLNLFAYTGSASVHAAGSGAAETTTVDMSQTYLDWAKRNMAANGFAGKKHRFIRADVLKWLEQEGRTRNRYDLIFCDPPTFSNSKTMGERTFDVQRDHVSLLKQAARILTQDGTIVFSCNLRNFKLDFAALEEAGLAAKDITAQTIPHDFERTPKVHRCFLVTKQA